MPTYDYECTKCGHAFETFQSMSDDSLVKCPSCAKNGLRRLIGGGLGVIFRGSGFYVNDSRNGGKGSGKGDKPTGESTSPAKTSGDSGSSDSSSGTSKSDSSAASSSSSTSKPERSTSGSKAAT